MNEDNLEERLVRWLPADPPRDLMRRLRAAEPSPRVKRFWPSPSILFGAKPWSTTLAGAGLLAAAALLLVLWSWPRPGPPEFTNRASAAHPGEVTSALPTVAAQESDKAAPRSSRTRTTTDDRVRVSVFNLSNFARPDLWYAVLDVSSDIRSVGGFQLDNPAGPMRLDCGYTLPGEESSDYLFGKFHLNANDHF